MYNYGFNEFKKIPNASVRYWQQDPQNNHRWHRLCGYMLACLAICTGFKHLGLLGWTGVIASASLSGLAYLAGFCYSGARPEEWLFLRSAAMVPAALARPVYLRVRAFAAHRRRHTTE
jgi:hypothetical protein